MLAFTKKKVSVDSRIRFMLSMVIAGVFHQNFTARFLINGFFEELDDDKEFPVIIIVRLKKQ